jgi:zinc transport system substrate-binding protein
MTALSKARAYFSIGVEFEHVWLPRFCRLNGGMAVVPMDSGVDKRPIDLFAESPAKGKGDSLGHDHHTGLDPHIWLSPELVKKQAETVCEALIRLDPGHGAAYSANYNAFASEITAMQNSIHAILNGNTAAGPQRMFMVFHPSWAYFAREFGLKQVAIEIEGKEPSARQLQTIIEIAQRNAIHTIFVQPQFSQRSAQIIARQLSGRVEIADDLAYDWKNNLIAFSKAIAEQSSTAGKK